MPQQGDPTCQKTWYECTGLARSSTLSDSTYITHTHRVGFCNKTYAIGLCLEPLKCCTMDTFWGACCLAGSLDSPCPQDTGTVSVEQPSDGRERAAPSRCSCLEVSECLLIILGVFWMLAVHSWRPLDGCCYLFGRFCMIVVHSCRLLDLCCELLMVSACLMIIPIGFWMV